MRMDPALDSLACYRVAEIDWCSLGGSDDLALYDFANGTLKGYLAE